MIYGGRFMRKSIKRIYALLCMVVMFVMMIPSMAFAAEADETKVAINVKVPDDWQNPCVWAWDEDGNNAFEAWPGESVRQHQIMKDGIMCGFRIGQIMSL